MFCISFVFCCFFGFVLSFLGGGGLTFFVFQVRWPEGPPHLALNPPYLVILFCLFSFFFSLSLLCF